MCQQNEGASKPRDGVLRQAPVHSVPLSAVLPYRGETLHYEC